MEFALTKKQLEKKRQQAQQAQQESAAPESQPPTAAGSVPPPPPVGGTSRSDPVTGLPAGYDPPAPPAATGPAPGSEFFASGEEVLGRTAPPVAGVTPPAAPAPSFADLPGVTAPPPPSSGPVGGLVPPPVASPPLASPPPPPPPPSPGGGSSALQSAPAHAHARTGQPVTLVEGPRPTGDVLVREIFRRYAGFVLFVLIAILLVEFLPSLRHSSTTPSGLGPAPAVPAAPTAPTAPGTSGTSGWVTTGAGVTAVTVSYG